MTAQPVFEPESWVHALAGRWTAQRALAELPETNEVTFEVFDGSLFVSARPAVDHQLALGNMYTLLRPAVRAAGLFVYPEINLVMDEDLGSPDLTVFRRSYRGEVWADVADVALIVEFMSPNHKALDRFVRPRAYAAHGVPWFMRVEFRGVDPVVLLHRPMDGEFRVVASGAAGSRFEMTEPFPFAFDPAELLDE